MDIEARFGKEFRKSCAVVPKREGGFITGRKIGLTRLHETPRGSADKDHSEVLFLGTGEIGLAAIKEAGLQPRILPELLASELFPGGSGIKGIDGSDDFAKWGGLVLHSPDGAVETGEYVGSQEALAAWKNHGMQGGL